MRRHPTSWRSVARLVSHVLFAALVAAVAATFVVLTVIPRLTGGAALNVLTGSMTPEIPVGSVVLIRPVDPGTLRVGDVATYQVAPDSKALITHRVQSIDEAGGSPVFVFKGDANRGADTTPVPAAAVRGEVWFHVPMLGSLRDGLTGGAGVSLLAVLLLVGYALTQLTSGVQDHRRRATGDAAARPTTVEVPLDRVLVVATVPLATVADRLCLTPEEAAQSWSGLLLAQDHEGFTVALTPPGDGVDAALRLLRMLDPTSVVVLESPGSMSLTGVRPDLDSFEEAPRVGA